MDAMLGIPRAMIPLRIRAALPEQYHVYLVNQGKRQYLTNGDTVELELCKGDSVTLLQDGPLTKLQKVLAAIGIFLTAPLQIAYLYYSDAQWDDVTPFRMKAILKILGDATCSLAIIKGVTQFHPPHLEISGKNVACVEFHCEASPWVFRQACEIYLCRVIGAGIWFQGLMGFLLAVGIARKIYLGILATSATCLATIFVVAYLAIQARHLCWQNEKGLEQMNR